MGAALSPAAAAAVAVRVPGSVSDDASAAARSAFASKTLASPKSRTTMFGWFSDATRRASRSIR